MIKRIKITDTPKSRVDPVSVAEKLGADPLPLRAPRFYVNDKSEFYWEVVDRQDRTVVKFIEKDGDDSNRDEAQRLADWMNATTPKGK